MRLSVFRLHVVIALVGCGSGDENDDNRGDSSNTMGGSSTTGSTTTGGPITTGTTTGTTTSTTMGSTGAAGAGGGVACDMSVADEEMCGDTACPPIASPLPCEVRCCTADNQCATLVATEALPGTCQAPLDDETLCPAETVLGQMVAGCCLPDGVTCGIDGTLLGQGCVPRETISLAPMNCDGTPVMGEGGDSTGGTGDAGGMGGTGGTSAM